MNDWNAQIIAEFRATGGKAAQFGDNPLVILHTIGAKSGELREIPLVAFVEGDDLYVFASAGRITETPRLVLQPEDEPDHHGRIRRRHVRGDRRPNSPRTKRTPS